MEAKKVYLKPVSVHAYRHPSGKNGEVVCINFVEPPGLRERLCYKTRWADGMEDYTPVSDVISGAYEIVDKE